MNKKEIFTIVSLVLLFVLLWEQPPNTKFLAGIFMVMFYNRFEI